MDDTDTMIAQFLKASNDLEHHLHRDQPLTALQHQTVSTTVLGLHNFLDSWNQKHRP